MELLLLRWESHRLGQGRLSPDADLTQVLSNEQRLRSIMKMLGYECHRLQRDRRSGGALPRGTALILLDADQYLGSPGLAQKFLDYIDQRAGLLWGEGSELGRPGNYRFPHHTFQEYLAGCHLVGQRHMQRLFFDRAAEGDLWHLVVSLGAEELLYNLDRPYDWLMLCVRRERWKRCNKSAPFFGRE